MKPNETILKNIFSGEHMKSLLGSTSWGVELLYALAFLAATISLIINITKLSASTGNPAQRSRALWGVLISGICLAILGSLGLVFIALIGFM